MAAVHRNLRMENQLIVDLIYTFLVRVGISIAPDVSPLHHQDNAHLHSWAAKAEKYNVDLAWIRKVAMLF